MDLAALKKLGESMSFGDDAEPRAPRGVKVPDWVPVERLGKEPDTVIARDVGMSHPSVAAWRKRLGLPVFEPKLKDRVPDWLPVERLGKEPDAVISRDVGMNHSSVTGWRNKLGIPPYREKSRVPDWLPVERLGKEPDTVIARDVGMSDRAVTWWRKRLGIKPFRARGCKASTRRSTPYVYAVANGEGFVKLGKSVNPKERLKGLQTGTPKKLEIVALVPGGYALERQLHEKFAHLRTHGEWFKDEGITDYMKKLEKATARG